MLFDVLVIAVVVDEDGGRMWRKIKMGGSGRGRGGLGRGLLGVQALVRSRSCNVHRETHKDKRDAQKTHKRDTKDTRETRTLHDFEFIKLK